jgi:hypothetical protein
MNAVASFLSGEHTKAPFFPASRRLQFSSFLEENFVCEPGTCVIFYSSELTFNIHTDIQYL